MLRISDIKLSHHCQGYARRDFLRIGSLAFAGLSLVDLLRAQAQARLVGKEVRDRSVVLLFLQGGPSHLESFDPKMDAPAEFRPIFGEVSTRSPGVTFGAHFTQLAAMTDRLSVVRSYGSGNTGHTYERVASGNNPTQATMGALYARVAGTNHPHSGLPTNVLVLPEAVNPQLKLKNNFETGCYRP